MKIVTLLHSRYKIDGQILASFHSLRCLLFVLLFTTEGVCNKFPFENELLFIISSSIAVAL